MNKPNLQSDSALYSLMLGAENELRKLRYSDSTIRHRWEVWKRYLKFSNKEDFQLQDWHDFLKKVYGIAGRTYAQSAHRTGSFSNTLPVL